MSETKKKNNTKTPIGVFVSDIHWRTKTPEYRVEKDVPFNDVIGNKLTEVLVFAKEHKVPIFSCGDLFDKPRDFMQMWTFQKLMTSFVKEYDEIDFYSVQGQHDMFHHDPTNKATSFNVMCLNKTVRKMTSAGRVQIYGDKRIGVDHSWQDVVNVYACGWGEEYPVPYMAEQNNILVLHKTLWHKQSVYPGQTEGNIEVESIKLAKLGYKTVFSGDNHKAFDVRVGGVDFHNLGAFTRNSVDLANQQPRFCILFDDLSVESRYVGEEDVFDIETSTDDKGHQNAKDEFSMALAGGFNQGDTFKGALQQVVAVRKCGDLELTDTQTALLTDILIHLD
jgi:hypothetical protein